MTTDWTFFSNPLASMYGPTFLFLYFIWSVVVFAAMWMFLKKRSPLSLGENISLPLMAGKEDPYFLAWLNAGPVRVLEMAMMRLSYDKQLAIVEKSGARKTFKSHRVRQKSSLPLTAFEDSVLTCFYSQEAREKSVADPLVKNKCQTFRKIALKLDLVETTWHWIVTFTGVVTGFVLLIGPGLYKLTAALNAGYENVLFLIIMLFVLCLFYYFWFMRKFFAAEHLTRLGDKYLERVRSSLPGDKQSLKQLDIAMAAVAVAKNDMSVYSKCEFGRQAYCLHFLLPVIPGVHVAGGQTSSSSANGLGSDDDRHNNSDSGNGCGGCSGD